MLQNRPVSDDQSQSGEPVGYLGTMQREGTDAPVRAVLDGREDNLVFVRELDPTDPEPEPIPLFEGDEVIAMTPVSHASIHTQETGLDGYLLPLRLVPVSRDGNTHHARVLRHGEHDDGRRVHARPGDTISFAPIAELAAIDAFEGRGIEGYVPLTPVLYTWMSIAPQPSDEKPRYLLAAARRLDQAQSLFAHVAELRDGSYDGAPANRRALFELVGAVELAVVSLSRAMDMCIQAKRAIGTSAPVPLSITSKARAVTKIRNAYEHIEDRALGHVWGKPHADAVTIFDHASMVESGAVTYGTSTLDLLSEVPELIANARQFLVQAAGEMPPNVPDSPTVVTA